MKKALWRLVPSGLILLFAGLWCAPVSAHHGNASFDNKKLSIKGVVTEFQLPPQRNPGALAVGPDRAVWFSEGNYDVGGFIARLTPESEARRSRLRPRLLRRRARFSPTRRLSS